MLAFLEKLTLRPAELSPSDVALLKREGITLQEAEEAVHVCALFNVVNRVADALAFTLQSPKDLDRSATRLLKSGYQLPRFRS